MSQEKRFCSSCGSRLDPATGLCPSCGPQSRDGKDTSFRIMRVPESFTHFTFAPESKAYSKKLKTVDIVLLVIALLAGAASLIGNYALYAKQSPVSVPAPAQSQVESPSEKLPTCPTVPTAEETVPVTKETAPVTEASTPPAEETVHEPQLIDYPVSKATASSTYYGDVKSHDVKNLLDDDPNTNWCEGVSGFGEGEHILLEFKDTYRLCSVRIRGGNRASERLFYGNGRPKDVTLTYSDGTSESFQLEDEMKSQLLVPSVPVDTDSLKITIDSVYEGAYREGVDKDTVISDIILEAYG